jgi:hypothetical protein
VHHDRALRDELINMADWIWQRTRNKVAGPRHVTPAIAEGLAGWCSTSPDPVVRPALPTYDVGSPLSLTGLWSI